MKLFTSLILTLILLVFIGCPPNYEAECNTGYHPCKNDPSECCLDTTSHYVDWTIDTLGVQGGDNVLNDAAIIDENNIWVVGDIQADSGSFEIVHLVNDRQIYIDIPTSGKIDGVYAFSDDDIWFASGCRIYHWDGETFNYLYECDLREGEINTVRKVWGTSQSNLFFIGNEGTIVHYNGTTFERMDSGTDVDLRSISGTDAGNVWVSGYNDSDLHTVLLHYDGNAWRTAYEGYPTSGHDPYSLSGAVRGVFTDDPDSVWAIAYLGLYRCPNNTQGEGTLLTQHPEWDYAMKTLSGNNHNDMIIAGAFSVIWHYNGNDLKLYDELIGNRVIYGSDTNQNVTVLVGYSINTSQALIIQGYR